MLITAYRSLCADTNALPSGNITRVFTPLVLLAMSPAFVFAQTPPVLPTPSPQQPAAQTATPGQTPTSPAAPQTGQVPPRDPRLQAPNVVETTIPPVITIPPPPVLPPDAPNRPLSADEAARIALRLQPNITIAQAALLAQRGRTTQVRSALLPQVSIAGGYSYTDAVTSQNNSTIIPTTGTGTGSTGTGTGSTGTGSTGTGSTGTGSTGTGSTGTGSTGTGSTGTGTTGTGTTTTSNLISSGTGTASSFTASATLRQLIFDFNHTRDLVRQSQELERAAGQNVTRSQYDTVYQVKQAFYLYAQDLQLVQVNLQEVANRQTQLDLATARYNTGLGLPSDVVTAQTAKAEAITNLTTARNNAEQSRINLALLIGIDPRTPITPADTVEIVPASTDVNLLTARALRQRPEVLQAQATIRAYQFGVSAARTTNAPIISGDLSLQSRGDQFYPQSTDFIAGVALSWTPIDGGLTRGRVAEARANVLSAQASLTAAQLNVTSDVAVAYVNLATAEQRVVLSQADVANAAEGVRIATGRYATGIGQFVDILNAEAFLLTARINLAVALASVQQARAALRHAVGDPPVP